MGADAAQVLGITLHGAMRIGGVGRGVLKARIVLVQVWYPAVSDY